MAPISAIQSITKAGGTFTKAYLHDAAGAANGASGRQGAPAGHEARGHRISGHAPSGALASARVPTAYGGWAYPRPALTAPGRAGHNRLSAGIAVCQ